MEEASKALTKLTDGRDRLDTLNHYYDHLVSDNMDKKQLNG